MAKVLIVLTASKEWNLKNGEKHFGGVWSPEFVYPHDRFTREGYDVTVGTLGGVSAPIDPASLALTLQENDQSSVDFQIEYLKRPEIMAALESPARLEDLDPTDFDVVFVPGGFGVYEDLGGNGVIGKFVADVYHNEKVVGTLCSGISSLIGAKAKDGSWPFAGKRMTGFPDSEMADFGVAEAAQWTPEGTLKQAGAQYVPGPKHTEVVVVDGNLITGQNGASSKRTAQAVVDRISALAGR